MPGLKNEFREQLLNNKLMSNVPANTRNFIELIIEKSWEKIVKLLEKRVEHQNSPKEEDADEAIINKNDANGTRYDRKDNQRFNGLCHSCQKPGHKKAECRKRIRDNKQRQGSEYDSWKTNSNATGYQENKTFRQDSNPRPHTDYRPRTKTFTFEAELRNEFDSDIEAKTVYCESFNSSGLKSTTLTRVEADVELDKSKLNIPILIDSGATASFINITKLPAKIADKISKFLDGDTNSNEFGLKRIDLTIKSALNTETVMCAIGKIKLQINSFIGEHEFIFTDITERAILGMDFLKNLKAVYDLFSTL
ncbi:unnamed protein product [Brachionus calyciflorus]|uniref:CCHC-type domain-containing protein n=1 Tax=Brachionus calyciflorus TaxID=104777 RepID=A0A814AS50_9BILA|nr:unnamed protein product [Brachionus calyciflorus]